MHLVSQWFVLDHPKAINSLNQRVCMHVHVHFWWGGGGLLHVDMFAHNKSGITYRDGNRRILELWSVLFEKNNLFETRDANER
jgi:hypothetical protein